MAEATWSRTPPSEPGWYWWRMGPQATESFPLQWLPAPKLIGYPDPEAPSFIRFRGWGAIGEWFPIPIDTPGVQDGLPR